MVTNMSIKVDVKSKNYYEYTLSRIKNLRDLRKKRLRHSYVIMLKLIGGEILVFV